MIFFSRWHSCVKWQEISIKKYWLHVCIIDLLFYKTLQYYHHYLYTSFISGIAFQRFSVWQFRAANIVFLFFLSLFFMCINSNSYRLLRYRHSNIKIRRFAILCRRTLWGERLHVSMPFILRGDMNCHTRWKTASSVYISWAVHFAFYRFNNQNGAYWCRWIKPVYSLGRALRECYECIHSFWGTRWAGKSL